MDEVEAQIANAVESGSIPGAVLLAAGRNGSGYSRFFGYLSVREPRHQEPLLPTTVLRLASTCKLITAICALQCVEKGVIALDDDVRKVVSDLKDIQVLTGFDGGKPVYEEVKGGITLR